MLTSGSISFLIAVVMASYLYGNYQARGGIKSFRDSLNDLANAGNIRLKGLKKGLRYLDEALRETPE